MDIYQKAINTFGEKAQIEHAIEELSELNVALCHYLAGRKNNVEEEIADVEIMMEQLERIFSKDEIVDIKAQKIERLIEHINKKEVTNNA